MIPTGYREANYDTRARWMVFLVCDRCAALVGWIEDDTQLSDAHTAWHDRLDADTRDAEREGLRRL